MIPNTISVTSRVHEQSPANRLVPRDSWTSLFLQTRRPLSVMATSKFALMAGLLIATSLYFDVLPVIPVRTTCFIGAPQPGRKIVIATVHKPGCGINLMNIFAYGAIHNISAHVLSKSVTDRRADLPPAWSISNGLLRLMDSAPDGTWIVWLDGVVFQHFDYDITELIVQYREKCIVAVQNHQGVFLYLLRACKETKTILWSIMERQYDINASTFFQAASNLRCVIQTRADVPMSNASCSNVSNANLMMAAKLYSSAVVPMPKKPVLLTAASSNHMAALRGAACRLLSTTAIDVVAGVYAYDLGLTDPERQEITTWPNWHLRSFPFASYPAHFALGAGAGEYAWKPVIIADALEEFGWIVWLDAGTHVCMKKSLADLANASLASGVATLATSGTIGTWTYPGTLDHLAGWEHASLPNPAANIISMFGRSPAHLYVSAVWRSCALHKDCIAPAGSSRANHRQDQAVLAVLLAHMGIRPIGIPGLSMHCDSSAARNALCYNLDECCKTQPTCCPSN